MFEAILILKQHFKMAVVSGISVGIFLGFLVFTCISHSSCDPVLACSEIEVLERFAIIFLSDD